MGCEIFTIGGNPAGSGGGGDASAFAVDFDTVNAAVVTTNLASLSANGQFVLIKGLSIVATQVLPTPGDFGQVNFGSAIQAVRNAVDASQFFGVPPQGPPPGTPALNSTGYQSPLGFGSPGGLPCVVAIAANVLQVVCTGVLGFTIRWRMRGQIYVFDGAARLVA